MACNFAVKFRKKRIFLCYRTAREIARAKQKGFQSRRWELCSLYVRRFSRIRVVCGKEFQWAIHEKGLWPKSPVSVKYGILKCFSKKKILKFLTKNFVRP